MNPVQLILRTARLGCLTAGPCLFVIGVAFAIRTEVFLHKSISADGTVTELLPKHNDQDDSVSYAPIFTFMAADGQSYTVTSDTSSNPPGFGKGQKIRVLYEEGNPGGARIDTFWQLWTLPLILGLIGTAATVAGYVLLLIERRRNRIPLQALG